MKCNTPVRAIYNYSLSTKSYCVCTKSSHWQISVYCSKWNGVRNYHRMATSGAIIIFLIRYQWSKHPQLKSSIHKMTDIIGIFSNYNYSILPFVVYLIGYVVYWNYKNIPLTGAERMACEAFGQDMQPFDTAVLLLFYVFGHVHRKDHTVLRFCEQLNITKCSTTGLLHDFTRYRRCFQIISSEL